jgi:HNH endonuclease/AP2 domain
MKTITLTQGKVAFVDDADFEWLSQWKWHALYVKRRDTWYAGRTDCSGPRPRTVRMHRLIMGEPEGIQIDHKDGVGLNNQRGNLRLATDSQSNCNRGKSCGCSSKFKGVSWRKDMQRWHAQIMHLGVTRHLGYFKYEKVAALAYDFAARELHEGFAKLNFPEYS